MLHIIDLDGWCVGGGGGVGGVGGGGGGGSTFLKETPKFSLNC